MGLLVGSSYGIALRFLLQERLHAQSSEVSKMNNEGCDFAVI